MTPTLLDLTLTTHPLCIAALGILGLAAAIHAGVQDRHRRAAQAHVERLAREQALLLNNNLVGMVRVKDRRILWANPAIHRILGYDEGMVEGASMRLLYPDDDTFERVGRLGYEAVRRDGRFHAQLRMRTRGGADLWVDLSAAVLSDAEFLWMVVDIDQLKHSEERAQHEALHDPLTGLANRRLFEELLRQAAAQARRQDEGRRGLTVCYLDLDGFKPINDRHGHDAGDVVLRAIGDRLARELRGNDSVARLGGDEFAWFLAGVDDEPAARVVVTRLLAQLRQPIALPDGTEVRVDASVGIATSAAHGLSAQRLVLAADEAMYVRKRAASAPQRRQSADSLPTVMTACSIAGDQGVL
jgi:diguanylate cyclase (GGDEF)-like protein/PAS domain S-box-containing protein